ncbi:MAG: DsbA family protein [Sphingomonadaceae bacterium]
MSGADKGSIGVLPIVLALVAGMAAGALGWREFGSRPAGIANDRAALEALVRETILDNPDIIPEAISRLQDREVEKLLASNREAIETPFRGAWAGNPEGDVVLVEFFDFACPFCLQSKADIDRLLAEDPGLKVVWRDFPVLGPTSDQFAMAALSAAGQGRYKAFIDAAFDREGRLSESRLIPAVRAARLDERQVAGDLTSSELRQELDSNLALGRALGLTGTPSYIIGDRIISGAVGYAELKEAIAAARKRARPASGAGTASR